MLFFSFVLHSKHLIDDGMKSLHGQSIFRGCISLNQDRYYLVAPEKYGDGIRVVVYHQTGVFK